MHGEADDRLYTVAPGCVWAAGMQRSAEERLPSTVTATRKGIPANAQ